MTTSNSILRTLNRLLKPYVSDVESRKGLIDLLVKKFEDRSYLKYELDNHKFLILSKDERKLNSLRRYPGSPFPLLRNLEGFSITTGEWNKELIEYGIQTREKLDDHESNGSLVGSHIYLVCYKTLNGKGNKYLKRQYKRLNHYRSHSHWSEYWELSWTLMLRSWSFRVSCLTSWKPNWYKELSVVELQKIFKGLNRILNLEEKQTIIRNIWIESPRTKWRQLCIPPRSWRLYLHMLNMFISFVHAPLLDPSIYHGFIYNRGCKSWWESVLWSTILNQYNSIIEVDLSSGFPNLHLHGLRKALLSHGRMPPSLINLILQHLKSPLKESIWFPTKSTYAENKYNRQWREGDRCLPMGLGISPILFVLTLDWVLEQSKLKSKDLTYKWYADDGSLYFNWKGLYQYMRTHRSLPWIIQEILQKRNPLISIWNSDPLHKSIGISFDPHKSSLVRLFGIWLKPYKSLGLSLNSESILTQLLNFMSPSPILSLQGNTRGRGPNPAKRKRGTTGSLKTLSQLSPPSLASPLTYDLLISQYKKYFGLFQSLLYTNNRLSQPYPSYNPHGKIYNRIPPKLFRSPPDWLPRFSKHNIGSQISELLLRINSNTLLPDWGTIYPNYRELKIPWKVSLHSILSTPNLNPLNPSLENKADHYRKYSELNLSPQEQIELEREYSLVPHSPLVKPKSY